MCRKTDSVLEILPWEWGKTWVTKKTLIIDGPDGKTLTVPEGFRHDQYSWAPNLPDPLPAIAHDYAYTIKKWDDGTCMRKKEADELLYRLMKASDSRVTRGLARLYWLGVRSNFWKKWTVS